MKTRLLSFFTLLSLAPVFVRADNYDALLKRYERQIAEQSRQLKSLRARLALNDKEIQRWQQKAEDARTQWNRMALQADQARERATTSHAQWSMTRTQAEAAEWEAVTRTLLSRTADTQLESLSRYLYAHQLVQVEPAMTVSDRLPEFLARHLAEVAVTARVEAGQAQDQQAELRIQELRLKSTEQKQLEEWSRLRDKQQGYWIKWQDAQRRRTALEEEKNQVEQSAQALQVMLGSLKDDKERALSARQGRSISDRALSSLRGTLPWPAQGRVIQDFGRHQSSDLNQLVVSNGIRIEPGAGKPVRAIQPGKVLFSSPFRQYGQLVIVQHRSGLTSVYAGLTAVQVKEGAILSALDPIGTVNETGSFYFELRRDEQPINPMVYLTPLRSQELTSRRTYR